MVLVTSRQFTVFVASSSMVLVTGRQFVSYDMFCDCTGGQTVCNVCGIFYVFFQIPEIWLHWRGYWRASGQRAWHEFLSDGDDAASFQHNFGTTLTCLSFIFNVRQSYSAHYWYRLDVRLSVCPSHAGIVSKRLSLSSNCLHCLVAQWFYFSEYQTFFPEFQWEHPQRGC